MKKIITAYKPDIRKIANPVVEALSKLESVKGIVCFGSYATGTFDKHSDMDLYVFCHPKIMPSSSRKSVLEKIEGITELQLDHAEFDWDNQWCPKGDRFKLHNLLFDITYNTVGWIQTVVKKVKEGETSIPELKFRPYTILGLLDNSLILYDPESMLKRIKSHLYPFPPKLKSALLTQGISVFKDSLADLQDYVKRGIGNTAFHFQLERIVDAIGTIMFALNERYDPATKRAEEAFLKLKNVPEHFTERYNGILATPLSDQGRKKVVKELVTLFVEIESLL
jgi:predicted nucleotidyltransferase